jgi:hypothetical protein
MGQSVPVLAEPWNILVVQEHAQDLDRPDGRGQDVRRLGALEEGLHPAAVLRRTGTAATGADRKGPARLGGHVLFHPQVKAPPGGEVVVMVNLSVRRRPRSPSRTLRGSSPKPGPPT